MRPNHQCFARFAPGLAALLLFANILPVRAFIFQTNGPLNIAREYHTTTLLSNGKLLIAGGYNGSPLAVTELFDPAVGTCSTNTVGLATARYLHTATLLPNGKVLVAGGSDASGNPIGSAELYDPVAGTWASTGSLNTPRYLQTATLLTNGMVLVAGGHSGGTVITNSAELYNPATGTWTLTVGPMNTARIGHTATLLPNGTVLVAGGANSSYLSTAEIYNPTNGTWTLTTGTMTMARADHTATLLANGQVLVAGGEFGAFLLLETLSSSELYNPTNGTWTATSGSMSSPHCNGTASVMPNSQKVLVVSGFTSPLAGITTNSVELYDPVSQNWQGAGQVTIARAYHTATLLPAGQLVLVGGYSGTNYLSSVETLVPTNGTWATFNPMVTARYHHTLTLLTNGQVLAAGGAGSGATPANTELFAGTPGSWTNTLGALNSARYDHTATLLTNGQVLVAGGLNGSSYLAGAEIYNPASQLWTVTNSMNSARALHTATMLASGQVLVAGGYNGSAAIAGTETYNPSAGTWATNGPLNTPRSQHTATLLPSGKVLVTGGYVASGSALSSVESFDPASGTWTTNKPMNMPRANHTATLLPSGKVLVAGGFNGTNFWLNSAELFDPASGTWTFTGSMSLSRQDHVAKLLVNGQVLVAGGDGDAAVFNGSETYEPSTGTWLISTAPMNTARAESAAVILLNGFLLVAGGTGNTGALNSTEVFLDFGATSLPNFGPLNSPVPLTSTISFTGISFRGISEASGGNGTQDSPTDYPLLQLYGLESGQIVYVPVTNWSATSLTSVPVTNVPLGWTLLRVLVNGVPSQPKLVNVVNAPKPFATVTFSNLVQDFDTTARSVSVTTVPPGLSVTVTYNGSTAAPTNVGNYTVVATVNDAVYQGGATNTLQIVLVRNFGVDVSHFQDAGGIPEANWTQMYAQGRRFAFMKASEGLTGPDDPTMATNVANALQAGLLAGVYHFAHPENRPTTNGAVQEADHFLAYAGTNIGPGLLRPVLDWESTTGSVASNTDWVLAFSQEIVNNRGAGAAPIIYCLGSSFDSRLANFALWLRDYSVNNLATFNLGTPVAGFANWAFIQYTDGPLGGISDIDENVCHDDFAPLSSYLIPAAAPGFRLGSLGVNSGGFHLAFTNVPGTHFTLLSATNVSLALSNWTVAGTFTETSPGQFQFTDPQATNFPQRFYRVRSP